MANIPPERVILAGIYSPKGASGRSLTHGDLSPDESLQELYRLAETVDYEPCGTLTQERVTPDGATYFGKGKVDELRLLVDSEEASRVIIDGILTPSQARNLEDLLEVPVIDRSELILGIFASRAVSSEGKLQVELAARQRQLSRLAGFGVDMSSPGAGIGTRGPGEQRIEVQRRELRRRISRLKRDLEKGVGVRAEQRKRRKETGIPLVSLVGYTNAGKSTLFTALTGDEAYADDRLFATLDPWTRRWTLPSGETVLLVDTVGFIRALPHELIAAFRATLEESVDADILVHVLDASSPTWPSQMLAVHEVLEDLGVGETPRIVCLNKTDKVVLSEIHNLRLLHPGSVAVSALFETGLEDLGHAVHEILAARRQTVTFVIPYSKWDVVFEIMRLGAVRNQVHYDDGAAITCELAPGDVARFTKIIGSPPQKVN